MQGASPLASPGLGGMRHWGCLWKAGCGGGLAFFAACRLRLAGTQRGGLTFWLPAAPAFSLLCCPPSPKGKDIPPTRARRALFPAGRGRLRLFQARGFAPCIPGGWTGQGASYSCRSDTQGTLRQEDRAQTIWLSQYSIFGKSSGGSGGLFQESPSVLPSVLPVPSANAVRRERVRERPSRCMTV